MESEEYRQACRQEAAEFAKLQAARIAYEFAVRDHARAKLLMDKLGARARPTMPSEALKPTEPKLMGD